MDRSAVSVNTGYFQVYVTVAMEIMAFLGNVAGAACLCGHPRGVITIREQQRLLGLVPGVQEIEAGEIRIRHNVSSCYGTEVRHAHRLGKYNKRVVRICRTRQGEASLEVASATFLVLGVGGKGNRLPSAPV